MNSQILIVDDRFEDRFLYKKYLGTDTFDFDELEDGAELLGFLNDKIPDLILLDWQMPKVSGLESLKLLKYNIDLDDIPVIIITGMRDEKVLEKAFEYGGFDFLNKPVSPIELKTRVWNALKYANSTKLLRQQAAELKDLIRSQKLIVDDFFTVKEELASMKSKELEKNADEKARQMQTMELTNLKLQNQLLAVQDQLNRLNSELKKEIGTNPKLKKLGQIERSIQSIVSPDQSWEEFRKLFEQTNPLFFKTLLTFNPNLTSLDMKHCGYIKMNVDNYELAKILGVEQKSLQMTRYRLKKKLKVPVDQNLKEFIFNI